MVNISVAEAALRLGKSPATVRRLLANGQLSGQKIGGRWIVHGEKLTAPGSATGAPNVSSMAVDVDLAFRQLRRTDIRDLWVPDVLNWEDFAHDPTEVLAASRIKCSTGQSDAVEVIDVPKGPYLSRAGSLFSLEDRIAYHALCLSFAPQVERRLSDRVFSSRLNGDQKRSLFKSGIEQWTAFRQTTELEAAIEGPWVAETDLVSYFETINHKLLFQELTQMHVPESITRPLRELLRGWRHDTQHGIPTGPDASRLLGNLFMIPVDEAMISEGHNYWRYMDDIRIIASSETEVIRGLRRLEVLCRDRGLILSAAKTKVRETKLGEERSPDNVDLDVADYLFRSGLGEARKAIRRILHASVLDRTAKTKHAKFALVRLSALVDRAVLNKILRRLDRLKEVSPESALYLRSFISEKAVQRELTAYLAGPGDPGVETYQAAWLLAAMLEVIGEPPPEWIDYATSIARDANNPSFLRVLAANLAALGHRPADIEWMRKVAAENYDPSLVRGMMVALARVDELRRPTVDAALRRHPRLKCTTDYLKGRKALPSLMQAGLWSRIRNVPNS